MQGIDPDLFEKALRGDLKARDAIFEANTGLIWACLRRYSGLLESEDLFQLGAIGLLKAIDRFDPKLGYSFSTFAVPHITGEMRRFLRDHSPVKVERRLKEVAYKARKYTESVRASTGQEPSMKEVAQGIGVETDLLVRALDATSPMLYIDEVVPSRELEYAMDPDIEASDRKVQLEDALSCLEEPERTVIGARFFQGKTQSEIAQELGVSQAHVSRLEKRALLVLKRFMGETPGISV